MGKKKRASKKTRKLHALKEFNRRRSNPKLLEPLNNRPLHIHRVTLVNFWREFGYGCDKKRERSYRSKEEVINKLIELGEIVLTYKTAKAMKPHEVRNEYVNKKQKKRGFTNFVLCFACGARAQCRHHIIWIMNGGRNTRKNIIPLCNNCHAEIHPWLKVV